MAGATLNGAAAACLCAALALGCSGERWSIITPLATPDAGPEFDAAPVPLCGGDVSESIPLLDGAPLLGPGHAGTWSALLSGEEAGRFPRGPLVLQLSPSAAELRFAAGGTLPALLDAKGGYLCHAPGPSSCASEAGFVAEFEYALGAVTARDSILSFRVFLEQPWDEWCRLQAPVAQERAGCEPFYDVEAAYSDVRWGQSCAVQRGDQWFEIDCDRLATLERHACVCSADSCSAAARALQVNLRQVAPDALEGALWFAADRALVVHFDRRAGTGTL